VLAISLLPQESFILDRTFASKNLLELAVGMVLSTLLTLAMVQTYRATHRGAIYSATFLQALFILTTCTTLIMVVIGSNIARAFSLVGALSIVRFRTAIKDPRDVGFVFASLALGMACGTGFYLQAALFTLFLCGLLMVLSRLSVGHTDATEAIVRVTVTHGAHNGVAERLETELKTRDARPVLINRVHEPSGQATLSWRVRTGDAREQGDLEQRLRGVEGVAAVGVFVMDDFNVL